MKFYSSLSDPFYNIKFLITKNYANAGGWTEGEIVKVSIG